MTGARWSKNQHLKYSATMKRKRDERYKQQHAPIVDAQPVDVDVPRAVISLDDAVNQAWSKLCLGDKLAALAHIWNSVAGD